LWRAEHSEKQPETPQQKQPEPRAPRIESTTRKKEQDSERHENSQDQEQAVPWVFGIPLCSSIPVFHFEISLVQYSLGERIG
jgi:hypothetical protein